MRSPAGASSPPHLLALPGTRWRIWRESGLRSAGFPAAWILDLCDPQLAELAEATNRSASAGDRFPAAYAAAAAAAAGVLRAFAADDRFREAVAWQNPELAGGWLRSFAFPATGAAAPAKRKHLLPVARYAQRYCMKNETIGFFGPVAWAHWDSGGPAIRMRPGAQLLATRTLYFETWAVDTVAQTLSEDPDLRLWLTPRLVAACLLDGDLLRRPHGEPVALSPAQAALLRRCDGTRTVREIVAADAPPSAAGLDGDQRDWIIAQLTRWRDQGVIHLDFTGPVEARPERTLRRKLERVGDPAARGRALAALAALERRRAAVAEAAGDPDRLVAAIDALGEEFEQQTGTGRSRRHGQMYAGRTLLYEDTRRAVDVDLGGPLLATLAPPLGLVLDSARWFVSRAGELFDELFHTLLQRCQERTGRDLVPLPMLLAMATPDFHRAPSAGPVATVVAELQRRWSRVLRVPADTRRHTVAADDIATRVRELFPSSAPRWASAVHFSPDLLIAASGPAAIARGDYQLVLGELHLAANTLESRPFVEQHPAPERLLRALTSDHAGRRVYSVPTKEWPQVNSRTYPSALLSPSHTYWCLHSDTGGAPAPVLPAAGLFVHWSGGGLVVRHLPDGRELPLMEVLGEQLSWAVVDGFAPLPPAPHQPRVMIDRLVIQRESWAFEAAGIGWASSGDPAHRFLGAQAWRAANRLPRAAFYKLPGERKPVFVDFSSVPLVDCLAQAVRRAATTDGAGMVRLTEALPGPGQSWLLDGDGAGYTSELRLVAVDPTAGQPGAGTGAAGGTP